MSFSELKEAAEHVTSGNAKLGEVIYGDDGVDMALDIDAVIGIVRDLATQSEPVEWYPMGGIYGCVLCGGEGARQQADFTHEAKCPWRRAVELTR